MEPEWEAPASCPCRCANRWPWRWYSRRRRLKLLRCTSRETSQSDKSAHYSTENREPPYMGLLLLSYGAPYGSPYGSLRCCTVFYGILRFRTVPYGVVRCRTVPYGAVRCWFPLSARASCGFRMESDPYAAYGAPPSGFFSFFILLHVSAVADHRQVL